MVSDAFGRLEKARHFFWCVLHGTVPRFARAWLTVRLVMFDLNSPTQLSRPDMCTTLRTLVFVLATSNHAI